MRRSSVVDSFFGAFLGFWVITIVSLLNRPVMDEWMLLLLLPCVAVTMWLLNMANEAEKTKVKCVWFVLTILASLFSSFVIQMVINPEINLGVFITLPRTWFLFCLVSAWFVFGGILIKK